MKKKTLRPQARKSRSAAAARAPRRAPRAEEASEDLAQLEALAARFEASERAWQRMTAAPEGEDTVWIQVEEHLLARDSDPDRGWKYFSK